MQLGAERGQQAQTGGSAGRFGGEIAGEIDGQHQNEEIDHAIGHADAEAQAGVNPLPADDKVFVLVIGEMEDDLLMEDVAHDFEKDENRQEGDGGGAKSCQTGCCKPSTGRRRRVRGERGRARRRPNTSPRKVKAARIGPRLYPASPVSPMQSSAMIHTMPVTLDRAGRNGTLKMLQLSRGG